MIMTYKIKDQISKNIVEINDEQFHSWIRGNDIEFIDEIVRGNVILKYKDDLVGCGKSNGLKVFNYVPKDRRLRKWQKKTMADKPVTD